MTSPGTQARPCVRMLAAVQLAACAFPAAADVIAMLCVPPLACAVEVAIDELPADVQLPSVDSNPPFGVLSAPSSDKPGAPLNRQMSPIGRPAATRACMYDCTY